MRLEVSISIKLPLMTDIMMNFTAEIQLCSLLSSCNVLCCGSSIAGAAL